MIIKGYFYILAGSITINEIANKKTEYWEIEMNVQQKKSQVSFYSTTRLLNCILYEALRNEKCDVFFYTVGP